MFLIDPSATIADLAAADKQIRFGLARGLTQLAKNASAAVNQAMPERFDRPTSFTMKAGGYQSASRDNLQSQVFIKDIQARYLLIEETGGERTPMPGLPINLPVEQRLNAYGNIPRGTIGRLKQRSDVFVSTGNGRTAGLPLGIYQRGKKSKRVPAPAPKLLIAFKRKADYTPRLGFRETVFGFVEKNGVSIIALSIANALDTAR